MRIKKKLKKILPQKVIDLLLFNKTEIFHTTLLPRVKFKQDSYSGERCFIIGGGPSINLMDLRPLNNEYCIAVNKGYLLKERGLKSVEFYGLSDWNAYNEYGNEIPLDFAKEICIFGSIPWARETENVSLIPMFKDVNKSKFMSSGFFQFNINKPVAHTSTVVLQMLQVAVYAGFKEIYFIGVDNDFSGPNMHFYQDSKTEKDNMVKWCYDPTLDNELAFSRAFRILTKKGIVLKNAGIGGKLRSLPRVEFCELFNET